MDPSRSGHTWNVLAAAAAAGPSAASEAARAARSAHADSEGAARAANFDQIYADHFEFVWRTVRRLGVAERSVDDAVQDVFIVVHRRLGDFEGRASLRTWLFSIARRVAGDYRRRSRRKDRGDDPGKELPDVDGVSPLESAESAQAVRVLHAILAQIPESQREVFVLAELEQMTAPEIADAVGAKLNTVYSRLRLARNAFNEAVERRLAAERRRQS